MTITLITVNYNGAEKTKDLMRSLQAQADLNFQFIIVDNGSTSEDVQKLRSVVAGSPFRLIENTQNLGFSGGNNVGIKSALQNGAEWLILINNDTTVRQDFISRLRANLRHVEGIAALPIQEEDERVAYGGRIKWLKPTLRHSYNIANSYELMANGQLYAIGAGMAIQREVFQRIGFLDERYFLYFEDADFCARALKAGITITPLSEPIIRHDASSTTRLLGSAILLRYHARNSLLFNWENGPWWARILLPFTSAYGIIFQLLKILFMPSRRALSRAIAAGILDFYARKFGHISTEN